MIIHNQRASLEFVHHVLVLLADSGILFFI